MYRTIAAAVEVKIDQITGFPKFPPRYSLQYRNMQLQLILDRSGDLEICLWQATVEQCEIAKPALAASLHNPA